MNDRYVGIKEVKYFEFVALDYEEKNNWLYMFYGDKTQEQWKADVSEVMRKYLDEYMVLCSGAKKVSIEDWFRYIDNMGYLSKEKGYVKIVSDGVFCIHEDDLDFSYGDSKKMVNMFGQEAVDKIKEFNK